MRFGVFLVICGLVQGLWAAPGPQVAVSDFSAAGIQKSEASLMTARFQSALSRTGSFTVLERSQMENILSEQGFQQTGACDSESCKIRMGQLLGVDYLIVGEVGLIGKRYVVTVRFLDVGTGVMRFTVDGEHDGSIEEAFSGLMPAMAKAVAKKYDASQKRTDIPSAVVPETTPAQSAAPAEKPNEAEALIAAPVVTETAPASISPEIPADLAESPDMDLSEWNWLRIGSYTVAALAAGGAVYSHLQSRQKFEDADAAHARYAAMTEGDFSTEWNSYTDNYDQGKTWALYRNILAGVATVGFAVAITTHF